MIRSILLHIKMSGGRTFPIKVSSDDTLGYIKEYISQALEVNSRNWGIYQGKYLQDDNIKIGDMKSTNNLSFYPKIVIR